MRHPIPAGLTAALAIAALAVPATAAEKRTMCVFDVGGANGDAFNIMKDYRAAAVAWGYDLDLRPYTDEKTAAEDFKAGQCDAALLTGVRVRQFVKFSGSVEAYGAVSSYALLKKVITSLSSPKAAKLMKSGAYETAGILPGGAVYLFVADRSVDTVGELAGKSIATLAYDKAAQMMVRHVGGAVAAAELGTFGGMFNNHSVDACYAPAFAYNALELHKGVGDKGGMIRYPLAMFTYQILTKSDRFDDNFKTGSREWSVRSYAQFQGIIDRSEKAVPANVWIDIPAEDRARYDVMFQEVRVRVRDEAKLFDKTMLRLLRRMRCKDDATRAECAQKKE